MRLEPLEFQQCLYSLGYDVKEKDKASMAANVCRRGRPCYDGCDGNKYSCLFDFVKFLRSSFIINKSTQFSGMLNCNAPIKKREKPLKVAMLPLAIDSRFTKRIAAKLFAISSLPYGLFRCLHSLILTRKENSRQLCVSGLPQASQLP